MYFYSVKAPLLQRDVYLLQREVLSSEPIDLNPLKGIRGLGKKYQYYKPIN